MKRQGVRGGDEEPYLLTLTCQMSDKKQPMRREEVAKNKEIRSTYISLSCSSIGIHPSSQYTMNWFIS